MDWKHCYRWEKHNRNISHDRKCISTVNTLDQQHTMQLLFGIGGSIDVETTGLSPEHDEIIEFALILFLYNRKTGEIGKTLEEYSDLREPKCSISKGAYMVHKINKHKLKGKTLDKNKILTLIDKTDFLVSHNAKFDYRFVTSILPETAEKAWFCTMNGICWHGEGFGSKSLQNLLHNHGIKVVQSHRALYDARAIVTLLKRYNKKGRPYLRELLNEGPVVI